MIDNLDALKRIKANYDNRLSAYSYRILVCGGAGCVSSDCGVVTEALYAVREREGMEQSVEIIQTGCMGTCSIGPVMLILPQGVFYTDLTPAKAQSIFAAHIINGRVIEEYTYYDHALGLHVPLLDDIGFFKKQQKIALRNCGVIEYSSLDAYIAAGGYQAAANALTGMSREQVIAEVETSGLRGRGGAGFPTGTKWRAGYNAPGERKYILCNADEGDPGAFMDRSILEGDPHTVIEGMLLGGYAIGAKEGVVYVRAEYPIAVERLGVAIEDARAQGLLGKNIFGSGFDFDLFIRIGAGAFVCGEETALLASVEGKRGEPRQKPPFPFQKGLFGYPSIINNVETYASIPAILTKGGAWYHGIGSEKSSGTKVFALAGDIVNTGIIEVPIGITLGEIIYEIGGGVRGGKKFKAAQIGGPSGGCITEKNLNVPMDYDSLSALGAIMGSGGLIVMSEDTCMVDTARYFIDFIQDESCGNCVPCRIGTKRMLEILERITQGKGVEGDIELLEEFSAAIKDTAMCGLGQTAPNPVLSALENFREEFEEHIHDKYCRASVCSELFISPCENTCPAKVNVPGYLSLVAAGRFMDAYDLIRQENPFPAVCGRICTRPCESKCRRGTIDEPLEICNLKRFVADYAFAHEAPYSQDVVYPKNGKRVAVIGAGVSGLTCAYYLVRTGYEVDVYESRHEAGGVLANGIPEYRLPKEILTHEIQLIEREGVKIHLGCEVGKDIQFKYLRENYEAIYVATGTQFPSKVNVPGEDLEGVIPGVDFLNRVHMRQITEMSGTAVIIGGGNTAIDSARTARRMGAERVILLYRRTRDIMPASPEEIDEALEEGIELMELVSPLSFVAGKDGKVCAIECMHRALSNYDSAGRRRSSSIPGSNFMLEVSVVIPAVSQYADLPFVSSDEIGLTSWGTFIVEKGTNMTTKKGVFAGGDVARGPDIVINAIADGKNAAINIDLHLGGKGQVNKGQPIRLPDVPYPDEEIIEHGRFEMKVLEPERRKDSFDEVVQGYHRLNAIAESMRCLHCERRAT